jgi:hypothetical protein
MQSSRRRGCFAHFPFDPTSNTLTVRNNINGPSQTWTHLQGIYAYLPLFHFQRRLTVHGDPYFCSVCIHLEFRLQSYPMATVNASKSVVSVVINISFCVYFSQYIICFPSIYYCMNAFFLQTIYNRFNYRTVKVKKQTFSCA